ncbi:MAG: AAA family ATPase [Ferruginibacter sp.]
MKILAIRIKNLASLEGTTEIDFTKEPLCSAGIFAITGPTGAGKSTILDALCLALYAKTPRYLQAKESGIDIYDVQGSTITQSDVRGILRDGSAEGIAEVDFAGVDGQHYRATWSVRRARNKAEGSLQSYTITLKNIGSNADIPGKKTELLDEIERLVGLTFEQFTRSVLLAQGDFTAFLKAGKDEKSSLLEKLTGTHIYSEISKRIFEKHRAEEQQLRDLNFKRQGIPTLTVEEVDNYAQQKAATEIIIQAQEKEADLLSIEINWHTRHLELQKNVAVAKAILDETVSTKGNAVGREQQLNQAVQVQPARTWVENQKYTAAQLLGKVSALEIATTNLNSLKIEEEQLGILLQHAAADLLKKINGQEDAKPLLDQAKTLDVQLSERTEQLAQASTEVKRAKENCKEKEKLVNRQQEEVSRLNASNSSLKKWKDENLSRQAVADNQSLVLSKLSDAEENLHTLQTITIKIDNANAAFRKVAQEKEDLETKSVSITNNLKASQQLYNEKTVELSAVNIVSLEANKEAIDNELEDLIKAEAHWKILSNTQTDYNRLVEKIAANKTETAANKILLKEATKQLATISIQRETSLKILAKAKLAAAENIELLRAQLIPGDECPVCGSIEHPYAEHNPLLDHVLSQLETTHQQHEDDYAVCVRNQNSLQERTRQLKETIDEQETAHGIKESALGLLQAAWRGFTLYEACNQIADDQKEIWIQGELIKRKVAQKSLQAQIRTYQKNKQQADSQQQAITQLDNRYNENNNAIKDTTRALQSLQEELNHHNTKQADENKELLKTEQNLAHYFPSANWFGHWKENPKKFVERINDFTAEWNTNTKKLEADSKQYDVELATVNAAQEQLQDLVLDFAKKEATSACLQLQLDELTQQRSVIFKGEATATIESKLKQAVAAAAQTTEKYKSDKQQQLTVITRLATQNEEIAKSIESLQLQLDAYTKKIQEWIIAHNEQAPNILDEPGLFELLMLTPAWIETERAALRGMDDAITQALSVLQERKTLCQQHELLNGSLRQPEEINQLLIDARATLQEANQEKTEIAFRLQQDTANKLQIGNLLNTINAQALTVENWAKLNDVIGSADGKKFRQIAQEYTLDVLLSYANVHLEMLSKRYLLQRIPNTLALQVLDQDMGNEIRTVYSLSGGESFLVSLALALGLASLSSSRMQVESLFIDEGFGSLDPTTLNIAMDALERLHNQGRKVGVISHVQEMTERIPVQIKVSKENSGRSRVEVLGI